MLKAVIFDLDQTLADTKRAHYLSLQTALESCGYKKTNLNWVYGLTSEELIRRNFPDMPEEDVKKVSALKRKRLINYLKTAVLLPGAKPLLQFLRKNKIKIVLVTNNTRLEINELLSQLEIPEIFSYTVGKEDAIPKPDKDPVVHAIEYLKLPLEEIVFVGDSNTDIESARAAGISIIINTQIHKTDTDLNKANWVVSNLKEAEKILRTLIADENL